MVTTLSGGAFTGDQARGIVLAEPLAYLALAVAAAFLRLIDLGWMPLDLAESRWALAAWQAAQGLAAPEIPGAPLLFNLQRAVFALWDGGDALARLIPALAGIALIPAAWTLRRGLGRAAALASATLFALDPLWVFFGRSALPVTLSAAALVLLIGALTGGLSPGSDVAAFAAAIALAAGGMVYSAAIAAGVTLVIVGLRRRPRPQPPAALRAPAPSPNSGVGGKSSGAGGSPVHSNDPRLFPTPELGEGPAEQSSARVGGEGSGPTSLRRPLAIFAITLAIATFGLLPRMDGPAALAGALGTWAAAIVPTDGDFPNAVPLALAVYAPLVLVFGIAGTVMAPRSARPPGLFIAVWVLVGAALGWLGSTPALVPEAYLPLTLAAGVALGRLATRVAAESRWAEDGTMIAILLLVLLYALFYAFAYVNANITTDPDFPATMALRVAGALAVAAVLVIGFAAVWGRSLAARAVGLTAVVALTALAWSNSSQLNYAATGDMREIMRAAYVPPMVRYLVADLADADMQATAAANPASYVFPVTADSAFQPELAWPLRQLRGLQWSVDAGSAGGAAPSSGAVIAPIGMIPITAGAEPPRSYTVAANWTPAFADSRAMLRWYLQRRSGAGDETNSAGPVYVQVDAATRNAPPSN